jgi:mono/diheme cytochrome c family protein
MVGKRSGGDMRGDFRWTHLLLAGGMAAVVACTGRVSPLPDAGPGAPPEPVDAGEVGGCAILALVQARCAGCHGAIPSSGAPMALNTLPSLRAASTRDPALSQAQRSLARMQDDALPMPPAPHPRATAEEIAQLAAWIDGGMPACDAADGGTGPVAVPPNLIPQEELFVCAGMASDAPTRLRRLNRWQWTRNVGGPVTRSWTGFSFYDNPLDPSGHLPYGSYAGDDTVDDAMVEIILPIVQAYGRTWAGPYTGGNRLVLLQHDVSLRCMWQSAQPTPACIDNYLRTLLERGVLYRPPTQDELSRLAAFAQAVLAQEPAGAGESERTQSLARIVTAASLTSGALFRTELGDEGPQGGSGRVQLSDWELAGQLAYALGDRGPGAVPTWRYPDYSAPMAGHYADLASAARDGSIRSPDVVAQLVADNVGGTEPTRFDLVQDFGLERRSRRGEQWLGDGVANFFRQWLGYLEVEQIFKERPEATSAFDDGDPSGYRPQLASWGNLMSGYYGYETTLVQQMDDFVASAVVPDVDVLETLLTSRRYFLAATIDSGFDGKSTRYTGQPYGTEAEINATNAERWRTLPASERAGVLTHPAFLASHGGNFEDDPSAVHRGKWLRENLLCGYVPPLSEVQVQAQVGPSSPDKSARARLEEATGMQACQGCHALMNPLGYPFEIYNHAGYLRQRDHAPDGGWMAPDGQVVLSGMPDPALDGPVRDAVELAEKLAASDHVKRCFIRHSFRYFMGRDENLSDACTLARMEQAYDGSNGSFRAMLQSLMTSDTWTTRRRPGQGE